MLKHRSATKVIVLILAGIALLLQGTVQADSNDTVKAHITSPLDDAQLERGPVEIVAEGEGFPLCSYADFHYSADPQNFELRNAIGRDSKPTKECTFSVTWNTSNFPEGTYYLRAIIQGWTGSSEAVAEDIIQVRLPPLPPSEDPSVQVQILKPKPGATLERGPTDIEVQGVRFDSCASALFEYQSKQEVGPTTMAGERHDSTAHCVFGITWDTTDPAKVPEGEYTLRATILGRKGSQDTRASAEVQIYIGLTTLTADFHWEQPKNRNLSTEDIVQFFSDSTPREQIKKWEWDFGDGTTDSAPNPSHQYRKTRTYKVTLTVTDKDGNTSKPTIKQITVEDLTVNRTIQAFGHLPGEKESLPRVLPGSVFRVIVAVQANVSAIAMVLDEDLKEANGKAGNWELVRWEASGVMGDVEFRPDSLEWILPNIKKGSAITVSYDLRVPSKIVTEPEEYTITGMIHTQAGEMEVLPNRCKLVNTLPAELVIAHLNGNGCEADQPGSCTVDPLDDDLVSPKQMQIAEGLWRTQAEGPLLVSVNSQLLADLICHARNAVPVTETCGRGAGPVMISAERTITAFPALPPRMLHQLLPGSVFQIDVTITPQEDVLSLILDEGFDGAEGLPEGEGWDLSKDLWPEGWKSSEPPTKVTFREESLEWLIEGPIKAHQPLTISYQVRVPDRRLHGDPLGNHRITGAIYHGVENNLAIPVTLFSVNETLPLKVALAYIGGPGCDETNLDQCQPDPLDPDCAKVSDAQLSIARAFWSVGKEVPQAEPSIVTAQMYMELEYYNKAAKPVTDSLDTCPAGSAPLAKTAPSGPLFPSEGVPIKTVIAHLKGEGCGADLPPLCVLDPEDDDLIDKAQINIAVDFWLKSEPVPFTASPEDGQPELITQPILLELLCYHVRQIPVTQACG